MTPSIVFKSHQEVAEYQGSNRDLDYIDHELSVKLDSTDAFEGPEKLLELWFSPTDCELPAGWPADGLRAIPLHEIELLLGIVHCEILSKVSSQQLDAYLLSESSLFVYRNKLILKTCGTTTTLLCFEKLRELVHRYCLDPAFEFRNIYRVFYSHRSFMFPDRQQAVHRSWDAELACLNTHFDSATSNAYVLGSPPGPAASSRSAPDETWHLYTNGTNQFAGCSAGRSSAADITVELLMTELDPASAAQFELPSAAAQHAAISNPDTQDVGHVVGAQLLRRSGLDRIVPEDPACDSDTKHDAFAFTPCGFSSNTILRGDRYYTIHVTPENGWSYASFETNFSPSPDHHADGLGLHAIVLRVLRAVRPGRFALVVCAEPSADLPASLDAALDGLQSDYVLHHHVTTDIDHGYTLVYALFSRT